MLLAILLLLFPQTQELSGVGDIWLRTTEPDILVYLDGKHVGSTSLHEDGIRLRDVVAGVHEITLRRTAGSPPSTFRVNVVFGETTELKLPGITLRAGDTARKGGLELRLDPYRPGCSAVFRNLRYDMKEVSLLVDAVPPGEYPVSVTCSGKTLNGKAEVLPGQVVIVRADFRQTRIGREGSRPRVTRLEIADKWGGLTNAPIPPGAKRAIINAMRPGVSLVEVKMIDRRRVSLALRATEWSAASAVVSNLRQSSDLYDVQLKENSQRGSVVEMKLILTVAGEGESRPLD
jgi:hypothetical protein